MTLPRFSSGQFGRLKHSHLNEAFALIDAWRAQSRSPLTQRGNAPRIINTDTWPALITNFNNGGSLVQYAGYEVILSKTGFVQKPSGRTMVIGDPVNIPAVNQHEFAFHGSFIEPNSIVEVFEFYDSTGLLSRQVAASIGGYTFPALISGSESIGANRWRYSWIHAQFPSAGANQWDAKTPGLTSTVGLNAFARYALNGCEAPNNGTGIEGVGVDMDVDDAILTMQPIAPNVVVQMTREVVAGTQRFWFSLPNAWAVECVK